MGKFICVENFWGEGSAVGQKNWSELPLSLSFKSKSLGLGSIVPALAKGARTGPPRFRMVEEKVMRHTLKILLLWETFDTESSEFEERIGQFRLSR